MMIPSRMRMQTQWKKRNQPVRFLLRSEANGFHLMYAIYWTAQRQKPVSTKRTKLWRATEQKREVFLCGIPNLISIPENRPNKIPTGSGRIDSVLFTGQPDYQGVEQRQPESDGNESHEQR